MNTEIIEFLYRRHYRYLFMVAYNICEKWDIAEDTVQDGFIKILGSKEVFEDWRHGRRYLCGCIRNAAFERLGRDKRVNAIRRDFIEPSISTTDSITINLYKLKSVMTQTILKEIYFHSRSRRQVAEQYEISREAVRVYEEKGLFELKKLITLDL